MPHIPNHPSAQKRHRQSLKRYERNHAIKARVRTAVKKALDAIGAGDRTAAEAKLREAISLLDKASSKGTLHRNTASRKISRLSSRFHKSYSGKTAEQTGS